jgi:tetratricopeptide (TPR) repeat protein
MITFLGVWTLSLLLMASGGNYAPAAVLGIVMALLVWNWVPAALYYAIEVGSTNDVLNERYAKVELQYARAVRFLNSFPFTKNSFWKSVMLIQIGRMRLAQGFFNGADTPMEEGILIAQRVPMYSKSPTMAMFHSNLGVAYLRQKRIVEAEIQFDEALAVLSDERTMKFNKSLNQFCRAYLNLLTGAAKFEINELDQAFELTIQGMNVLKNEKPPSPLQIYHVRQSLMNGYVLLAVIQMRKGDVEDAKHYTDQFFNTLPTDASMLTTSHIKAINLLAQEYLDAGDNDRAERLMNVAYAIGLNSPFHPDALESLDIFEKLLVRTDRKDEVADMRSWLRSGNEIILL